jgi:hypothetical protein
MTGLVDDLGNPDAPEVQPAFRLSDSRQREIHERLGRLVGPGPAAHFFDACRLMAEPDPFLSTTNLVAHLLREIEGGLRKVLVTMNPEGAPGSSPEGHRREVELVLAALELSTDESVSRAWLRITDKDDAYSLPGLAHRRNLEAPRAPAEAIGDLWRDMNAILSIVLERFERTYAVIFRELDRLRNLACPTGADADTLVIRLPNNLVARQCFFEGLENPAWLPLLRERGVFRDPPAPIVDEEKGTIGYGWWPASRFLTRMAAVPRESVQAEVASIFADLPATQNVRVLGDMLSGASVLPVKRARPLLERLMEWVGQQQHLLFLDVAGLGALASRFLAENECEVGTRALHTLLRLSPTGDTDARSRLQPWDYRELVRAAQPGLAAALGEEGAVGFFLDVLEEGLSRPPDEATDGVSDHSEWWLPVIETDDPDRDDLRPLLVHAVLENVRHLLERDPSTLDRVVDGLVSRRLGRFLHARIALHVLRTSPVPEPKRIGRMLSEPRLVGELEVRREYCLLLRERFGVLAKESQQKIVEVLVQAPHVDRVLAAAASRGEPLSPEDALEFRETTVRDLLGVIHGHLDETTRRLYEGLVARRGPAADPAAPLFTVSSNGFVGSKSPTTAEELKGLSIRKLRAFLDSWVPPVDPFQDASPEGLARELSGLVAADPERFARELDLLRCAEPTYVRGILQGFGSALKDGKTFQWSPVLGLCDWVLDQPRGEVKGDSWGRDEGWSWSRGAINDLFEEGLKDIAGRLPWSLRMEAWRVLERLTHDPSPADADGDLMTAINSIRGRALERVIEYAVWVKGQTIRPGEREVGFEVMPEVRSVLDAHLDPIVDPSPAIRTLYGTNLGRLYWLDKQWLAGAIDRLFPSDASLVRLRRAAWGSYLKAPRVHAVLFALLERTYREEVALLGQAAPDDPTGSLLGQHLVILYWNGRLSLEPDSLLVLFFRAPDKIRAHAIDFAGRIVRDHKDKLPPGLTERYQRLWEWRLEELGKHGAANARDELAAFITWFAAGVLDPTWAADRLIATATLRRGLPASYTLLKALETVVATIPEEVLRLLKAVVRGETDAMNLSLHAREIRAVLSGAQAATTPAIRSLMHEVISLATARGCAEFVDLDPRRTAT